MVGELVDYRVPELGQDSTAQTPKVHCLVWVKRTAVGRHGSKRKVSMQIYIYNQHDRTIVQKAFFWSCNDDLQSTHRHIHVESGK